MVVESNKEIEPATTQNHKMAARTVLEVLSKHKLVTPKSVVSLSIFLCATILGIFFSQIDIHTVTGSDKATTTVSNRYNVAGNCNASASVIQELEI